jgi:hypothetical protein
MEAMILQEAKDLAYYIRLGDGMDCMAAPGGKSEIPNSKSEVRAARKWIALRLRVLPTAAEPPLKQ